MNDSDDGPTQTEELSEATKERWSQRLASKEPLMSHLFDLPMNILVGKEGEILIDCPCLVLDGFDRPGVVRVELTAAATDRLRHALIAAGRLHDAPGGAPPKRSTH